MLLSNGFQQFQLRLHNSFFLSSIQILDRQPLWEEYSVSPEDNNMGTFGFRIIARARLLCRHFSKKFRGSAKLSRTISAFSRSRTSLTESIFSGKWTSSKDRSLRPDSLPASPSSHGLAESPRHSGDSSPHVYAPVCRTPP